MPEWKNDKELFALMKKEMYSGVLCDMLDTIGYSHQYLPETIQPLRLTDILTGRAFPVIICDVYGEQKEPLGKLTQAVDAIGEDQVYMVTGGANRCSYFGEIMTATCKAHKAAGAVIDGALRDTRQVLEQDFPVFHRGRNAMGSVYRNLVIEYNVPIEIGNIRVNPGDLVFGDIDGVVVIPKEIEVKAVEITLDRIRNEKSTRSAVESGMSAVEAVRRFGVF
jgi:regulator of RNase E activity RraA